MPLFDEKLDKNADKDWLNKRLDTDLPARKTTEKQTDKQLDKMLEESLHLKPIRNPNIESALREAGMHKRTQGEKELDMQELARMYLQGYRQSEMTDFFNSHRQYQLSKSQIATDLKELRITWLKSALVDFDEAKSRELAKIDELEREYWQAWRRSQEKKETVHAENTSDIIGKQGTYTRNKAKKTIEDRVGDVAYLMGVERCVAKRCEILGLNAPKTVNVNWREEARKAGVDPDEVSNKLISEFMEAAKKGVIKRDNAFAEPLEEIAEDTEEPTELEQEERLREKRLHEDEGEHDNRSIKT